MLNNWRIYIAFVAAVAACSRTPTETAPGARDLGSSAAALSAPQCVIKSGESCVRAIGRRPSLDGECEVFVELENRSATLMDASVSIRGLTVTDAMGNSRGLDARSAGLAKPITVNAKSKVLVGLLFAAPCQAAEKLRGTDAVATLRDVDASRLGSL